MVLVELIQDLLPLGIINGYGVEMNHPLVTNVHISKITLTGSTVAGQLNMQYATENIILVALELYGKSPNILFEYLLNQ